MPPPATARQVADGLVLSAPELTRQAYQHERGIACKIDLTQAFRLYRRAARLGFADAQYRCGFLLILFNSC